MQDKSVSRLFRLLKMNAARVSVGLFIISVIVYINIFVIRQEKSSDCSLNLYKDNRKSALSYNPFQVRKLGQIKRKSSDYVSILQQLNKEKVPMDDPRLIEIIRDNYIDLPSEEEYHLQNPHQLEYSEGQAPFVDSRLNYIEGGFYVECGALDGETRSNTLFFEKVRKWNGILIEADPLNYAKVKSKNRKAFGINACLSLYQYPSMVYFKQARNLGRTYHGKSLEDRKKNYGTSGLIKIQCFPLYSILLALNQTTVDYFSLDVEGDEFEVLKTIPFDKVNIKMLSVEYEHHNNQEVRSFMSSQGYDLLLQLYKDSKTANDWIFRKKALSHTGNK